VFDPGINVTQKRTIPLVWKQGTNSDLMLERSRETFIQKHIYHFDNQRKAWGKIFWLTKNPTLLFKTVDILILHKCVSSSREGAEREAEICF
jgi:hypothetical protein